VSKRKKVIGTVKSILRSTIKPTPVQINVLPSYKCNLNCGYCNQRSNEESDMSIEGFKGVVKKAEELHAGHFNFTGGEPLLWSSIIDAIAYLTEKHFASHITSNGFSLDDKVAKELGKAELDILNISLDGIEDILDSDKTLSKHEEYFTKRLCQLKDRYNIRIKINGVITQNNIHQIPLLLDYSHKNGFLISLGYEVPDLNTLEDIDYKNKLPEDIMKLISAASRAGLLIEPIKYFDNPKFNCYIVKKNSLSIGPNLDIQYCFKTGQSTKRITEFQEKDYPKYFEGLKKHISLCNPLCASNCAYMADYFMQHPIRAVRLFMKK